MVSRSKVRQCRNKKPKCSGRKTQQMTFEQENGAELGLDKTPSKKKNSDFQKLEKQQTASTLERRISVKEEAKEEEDHFESSYCESSRFEHSANKKVDLALTDPMWKFYPKQVQNVLKKKRIDRDRLRRSLKPPGKRNYKVLFANIKKISEDEVAKSSIMFKNMKDVFYKLIKAEKVVRKALLEKGLFLDQKDFNIMEIFNSAYRNYSEDYDSEYSERDREQEQIYVEELQPMAENNIQKLEKEEYNSIPPLQLDATENLQKPVLPPSNFELSSVGPNGTPISQNFDKFPLSQKSHKSHQTFISKSSHRLLFADYQVEKRPQVEKPAKPKKDFLCTCNHRNNLLAFYPIHELPHLKLNPYM